MSIGFGIFITIFGIVWGGIPTVFIIPMVIFDGAPVFVLLPMLIFTVIGTCFVVHGIKTIIKCIKLKSLERNRGTLSKGTYISHYNNVTVNGQRMYCVEFAFVNQYGKTIKVKSPSKYSLSEAEFFSQIGTFDIKYENELAIIVQPIDYNLISKQRQAYYSARLQQDDANNQQNLYFYVCEYCENSQNKLGKCKSCGANILSKNKKSY